jgi:hypothetical protein
VVGDLEDRRPPVPAQPHVDRAGRVPSDVPEQLAEDQLGAVEIRGRIDLRREIALEDRARVVRERRVGDAEGESAAVRLQGPAVGRSRLVLRRAVHEGHEYPVEVRRSR